MNLRFIWKLLLAGLLIGLLGGAGHGVAAEPGPAETSSGATDPEPNLAGAERFDATHDYLSGRVEALSRYLDSFFGETRIYDESNDTYLQVRGSVIFEEDETFFNGDFRAKMSLPNLSRQLRLVLENRRLDERPTDSRITSGDPDLRENLEGSDLFGGLEFGVDGEKHWKLTLRPGVRLDDLDPTVSFRARRQSEVHGGWQNRLTLTPAWFESEGWEASAVFELERIVLSDALFRSSSLVFWEEQTEDNYRFGQLFQLIDPLNRNSSLAYEIGVTARTQPEFEDESYFGSVRYRRNVHQGWMFVELKPQLLFARDEDFDPEPSLALTLEVLLGGPYREEQNQPF